MSYRLEVAKSSRSGCTNAECKKNGDKIEKGALRHGVMVTIQEHQTWKWRHWGCVSPKMIANMKEATDNDFGILDGFDDLSGDAQDIVRRAFQQGHVDDNDWKGDAEQNRPGARYFRTPVKQKKAAEEVETGDDQASGSPSKPAPKKRGRAKKEKASDAADAEEPPAKKKKAPAKKDKQVKGEEDEEIANVEEAPTKKPKAVAKQGKKGKDADAAESDEAPAPKKARGRKNAVKGKIDDDQEEPITKGEEDDEIAAAPVKKSRAPRKAATAKTPIVEEDGNTEEAIEGAAELKKGRKKGRGKKA